MLIQRIRPQEWPLPGQEVHGVFDIDPRQDEMGSIGDDPIDRTCQPFAEIDDMRQRVLNGPAARVNSRRF